MVLNKLRLIKIYELRGKVHPIEASIIDLLDGIKEVPFDGYIEYMKNGEYYFDYIKKSNNIQLFYTIYKILKCSLEETNVIMKYLLDKHLKLEINGVK